jgi:hypothetical protein
MGIRTTVIFTVFGAVALMGAPFAAHAQWMNTGLIENGGFEVDAVPEPPGYTTEISGWSPSGVNALINDAAGPFYVESANGPIPEGSQLAGLQGEGTLSQDLAGLVDGQEYRLNLYVNGRNCCPGEDPAVMSLRVILGTQTLVEIAPVTLTSVFQLIQQPFEYDASWGSTLTIQTFDPTGDATVMFDGVALFTPIEGDTSPFPPAPEGTPIAGPLGLVALMSGVAAGGAMLVRRRKR